MSILLHKIKRGLSVVGAIAQNQGGPFIDQVAPSAVLLQSDLEWKDGLTEHLEPCHVPFNRARQLPDPLLGDPLLPPITLVLDRFR